MKFTRDEIRRSMLLYAVTDRAWLHGRTLAEDVEKVLQGGATFLQLREKDLDRETFLREARQLKTIAARCGVPFVVNDAVDIALEVGADGVHVGQEDIAGKDVRAIIGPDMLLGISAHTVEEAVAAQKGGADYIGVGAAFATSTKDVDSILTVADFRAICDAVDIPVVAIGGIHAGNILSLKGSGVDGVAVVSAIFAQPDVGAAAAALLPLARELVESNG